MIRVEFKQPVNGINEIMCISISSDPMNSEVFLLQLKDNEVMEIYYKRIKHISSCK